MDPAEAKRVVAIQFGVVHAAGTLPLDGRTKKQQKTQQQQNTYFAHISSTCRI
jgi:hypothetical protein